MSESQEFSGHDSIRKLLSFQSAGGATDAKQINLTFSALTVTATKSTQQSVKTLPKAILNSFGPDQLNFLRWLGMKAGVTSPKAHGRKILSDFTGLVRPGEMLFLLGQPGSGCSTLLRTLANRGNLTVDGDLKFAGVDSAKFGRNHRRETIYMPEEDGHIAALSVRQTVQFALRMSVPSSLRNSGNIDEMTKAIGDVLRIGHVMDTAVGGQYVQGVSGGERKRVSIAEVFVAGATVQCFDNSTRGLDSSTALDFVKALRVLTDLGKKTTVATLYQAGENIYNHFDKVCILDSGLQIYFGPIADAKTHFEEMGFIQIPGQTTAEFLTGITDPTTRQTRPGSKAEAMASSQDLANAFKNSSIYSQLVKDIDALSDLGQQAMIPTKSYQLSYPHQIYECLKREYELFRAQMRVYQTKIVTTVILGLAIGSEYFDVSTDTSGAQTRGSIFFFALILNGWFQFPELFDAHTNRPVLERQASLNLYRPSAVAVARVLFDLPLIAFQSMVFVICYYFLVKLPVDGGHFFFFYLNIFITTVCYSNLLRMFAYYVPSLDDCFRYGGTASTVCNLFCGYLLPVRNMSGWIEWLHKIDPVYYAFENLFVENFVGQILDCAPGAMIPDVPNANVANQICEAKGAVAGSSVVMGSQFAQSFGFQFSHRWRNIGIMISIAVIYALIGAVGSEIMTFVPQGGSPVIFAKASSHGRSDKDPDPEREAAGHDSVDSQEKDLKSDVPMTGPSLTWRNMSVTIGEKNILRGLSGYARPGDFIALCGPSGAGKTTLLRALSNTNFSGKISGDVKFGGAAPSHNFRKTTGFVQQMDLHDGTATIREAFEFSALLRQPKHFSRRERLAYVDVVLSLLDLRSLENALIGDENSGLGVEILKRVTIGVELAARPSVLFADEPTSGLDSQAAIHIIDYLQRLSRQGQTVIVTIHQPSASLFAKFDKVLALSSNGGLIYFGPMHDILPYFSRHGAVAPADVNPAEFILDTIGASGKDNGEKSSVDWPANWQNGPEAREVESSIPGIDRDSFDVIDVDADDNSKFNAPIVTQIYLLTRRILYNQWRNTPYMYSKIWAHCVSAILVSFTLFQIGTGPQDLQNRAFSVYTIVFLVNSVVNTILSRFYVVGLYWEFREGPSRTYNWQALCTASILAELPGSFVCTVLYFVLWYFPSGLPLGGTAAYIFLMAFTYGIFQASLFMMALSPDLGVAGNILVFIICTLNWYNGLIVPYNQIQVFWRYWLYYLSPFTYFLGGMTTAVIRGQQVVCSAMDLSIFDPPSGQTCGAYAGEWATQANAQLLNPSSTANCSVCKWTTGDQFLEGLNLGDGQFGGIWGCWGIVVLFTLSNAVLLYFFFWATKVKRWKLFYFF
ncbi:ABC-2 type transporter-domain-containing protein [Leptodontidium sp. 2 PMI_412]|nr:ABC-2 type transporter-domain-containing protein [Leptodontidium sp. 2 PMI_412]